MDAANRDADAIALAIGERDRISRLVTDLLAFARRDDVVVADDLDVATVCRRAVAQTAPLAAQHAVTVDTELDEVRVRGDRDRLTQVIANLCRNAIEALAGVEPPRRVLVCCRLTPSGARDRGTGRRTGNTS
jgi:signal transduction histidine kinase